MNGIKLNDVENKIPDFVFNVRQRKIKLPKIASITKDWIVNNEHFKWLLNNEIPKGGRNQMLFKNVAIALNQADMSNNDKAAVAAKMGQTERWVRSRAKVRDLTPAWQKAVTDPVGPEKGQNRMSTRRRRC